MNQPHISGIDDREPLTLQTRHVSALWQTIHAWKRRAACGWATAATLGMTTLALAVMLIVEASR